LSQKIAEMIRDLTGTLLNALKIKELLIR